MHIAEIEPYEILKSKLGEKEAKALVEYIEAKVDKRLEEKKDTLATKQDITDLEIKIERTKSDIIKWMFIFWVGQIGVFIAILQIFFK